MAGITDELASPELSVSSNNYTVTRLMPDGERVEAVPPILESDADRRPSYWIPRQGFLGLLSRASPSSVQTHYGSELVDISRTEDGGLEVVARDAEGHESRMQPSLLVGADGLTSAVRAKCAEWSLADPSLGAQASDFVPVELPSPSSGLEYKMIRLPPAFPLEASDASDAAPTAQPRKAYSFRPAETAPLGPTRLGLLPVADPSYPRTANVILPPEHPVWKLESADDVSAWLKATFPTLPMDTIVSRAEAEAFASGRAGVFPAPCYTPRQALLLPNAGVCLVGDAVHAFPPDIGQGVNAALADVMHLADAFEAADGGAADGGVGSGDVEEATRAQLGRVLPAYEAACGPEAEAVARIAQVGFPYQYPITRERSPVVKLAWFVNFFARTFVLSKLLPRAFSPSAIVLVQRPQLTYTQVWALARKTTRRMQAIAAVALSAIAWPILRRCGMLPI